MAVSSEMKLFVKRLSEKAKLPVRGSKQAAGYDLSSAHDVLIPARGKALVKTDLAMIIPEGCYGRIAPRSGLSWKKHLDIGAGVIDRDYRGNVGVVIFNHAETEFQVTTGDRVAQLILERLAEPDVVEVDDLTETERGCSGYGSTGVALKRELQENPPSVQSTESPFKKQKVEEKSERS